MLARPSIRASRPALTHPHFSAPEIPSRSMIFQPDPPQIAHVSVAFMPMPVLPLPSFSLARPFEPAKPEPARSKFDRRFLLEPRHALGIMRRQVNQRLLFCERPDPVQGPEGNGDIGTNPVHLTGEKERLAVTCVAREKERWRPADHYRNMLRRMSRRRNHQHIGAFGQRHAFRKRAKRPILEANELGLPPLWPAMRQVTLYHSADAARPPEFLPIHPSLAAREMSQSSRMIGVKMG